MMQMTPYASELDPRVSTVASPSPNPTTSMASKSWSKPTGFGVEPIGTPTPASRTSKPHVDVIQQMFLGEEPEKPPPKMEKKHRKLLVECFKRFARIFWKWRCGGNGRGTCKVGIVKWIYLTEIRGFCANCQAAQCLNVPSPPLSSVKLCLYPASFYQT